MAEQNNTHTIKKSTRTLLMAAVIAVLLIGTALAVTYSGWSGGLQERLHITDDQAAALETTAMVSHPVVSDAHGGVTVSLEQAVVSGYTAHLALRVEGVEVPEGYTLAWEGPLVTLDGEPAPGWYCGVYEDLHWDGKRFVYGDGTPAPQAAEGYPIPHIVREDGSVELDVSVDGMGQTETLVGKEITVTIDRLGVARLGYDPVTPEFTAEGPWVLTWTAEGTEQSRTWDLAADLGHGITLSRVVLAPLSVRIEYRYPPLTILDDRAYDEEGSELSEEPPQLERIIMRDGTERADVLGSGVEWPSVEDESELENGFIFFVDRELTHVIDPDEVAALVFRTDVPGGKPEYYTVDLPE